jgi:hypothetical protein
VRQLAEALRSGLVEKRQFLLGLREQLLQAPLARRVPATQLGNARSTLLGWQVEKSVEQRRQLIPVRRKPGPFTVRRIG